MSIFFFHYTSPGRLLGEILNNKQMVEVLRVVEDNIERAFDTIEPSIQMNEVDESESNNNRFCTSKNLLCGDASSIKSVTQQDLN